jgi:hypothetical protein
MRSRAQGEESLVRQLGEIVELATGNIEVRFYSGWSLNPGL